MKLLVIHTILIIASFKVTVAQQDCRKTLLEAVNDMRKIPKDAKVHISYAIKTTDEQSGKIDKYNVEVKASGKTVNIASGKNQIYQNESVTISIFRDKKLIYLTKPVDINFREQQFGNIGIIQDSIMNKAEIIHCKQICISEENNKTMEEITIKIPTNMIKHLGIEKVTYRINIANRNIERIHAITSKSGLPSMIEMDILTMNKKFEGPIFSKASVKSVLARPQDLKKYFEGYKIIDHR